MHNKEPKKRLIPFWMTFQSIFLGGTAKKLAEIDYYYDDEIQNKLLKADILHLTDFDRESTKKLILKDANLITNYEYYSSILELKVKCGRIKEYEYEIELNELKFKEKVITEVQYSAQKVELMPDGIDKRFAALEHAFKFHDITEREYQKEYSTLKGEPWFDFDVNYNPENSEIEFGFDYNEFLWKKLKEDGHPGDTEDEIIDNFIRDWGRKMSNDEYNSDFEDSATPVEGSRKGTISEIESSMNFKFHK